MKNYRHGHTPGITAPGKFTLRELLDRTIGMMTTTVNGAARHRRLQGYLLAFKNWITCQRHLPETTSGGGR